MAPHNDRHLKVLHLGDGVTYMTIDILAEHLRVPPNTLRRWAVEDHWPMRKVERRRYYLASSAQQSYIDRGRAFRDKRRDTLKRGA